MDIGGLLLGRSQSWRKAEVVGEAEGPADSRNAANNVSAINGAAVPSVGSSMGGFDENSVGTAIVTSNSDSFVQEAVEVFDTNGFMIATGCDMEIDAEDGADFFEETFEGTAVVDNNEAAEANFQENVLDKQAGKVVRSGVVSSSDKDEAGKIAHGVHEIGLATVVFDFARGPKVDMKDVERAAEGSGENELAVAGDSAVGSEDIAGPNW